MANPVIIQMNVAIELSEGVKRGVRDGARNPSILAPLAAPRFDNSFRV